MERIVKIKLDKLQEKLKGNMANRIAFGDNNRIRMEDDEFEKMIIQNTAQGIIDMYGYDRETVEKIVAESELRWSIKVAPEMISHCSKEQLVDMIIG